VIEMSQSSWLVAAIIPGVERQPTKKLTPDEEALLRLLHRWRRSGEIWAQSRANSGRL
jgi:transposase